MRILIVGATGLIGSAIAARLIADGEAVTGLARRPVRADAPEQRWVRGDITRMSATDWSRCLDGIDAVVNCAGVLQDMPGDNSQAVHVDAVAVLLDACRLAGIRRYVHLSAIGVDRGAASPFSAFKGEGDKLVAASGLDWVILRPSLVLGRRVYGGSAAIRALAASPLSPELPDLGPIQTVQLDDVAATVAFFLRSDSPSRVALDVTDTETQTLPQIVAHYRRWLGWPPARRVAIPAWVAAAIYKAADLVSGLGWRPPLRSTSRLELARGIVGDPTRWTALTGITPRPLAAALAAEPAGVEQRWFARLYFLKAALVVVLSLFWIATGAVALGPGYEGGVSLLREAGAGMLAAPLAIAGAVADVAIGVAIAVRRWSGTALWAAVMLSALYLVLGTLLLPRLWSEPLGPLVKIIPILVLHLVAIAIREDR